MDDKNGSKVKTRPVAALSKWLVAHLERLLAGEMSYESALLSCTLNDMPVDCLVAIEADGDDDIIIHPVAIMINDDLAGQLRDSFGDAPEPLATSEERELADKQLEEMFSGQSEQEGSNNER